MSEGDILLVDTGRDDFLEEYGSNLEDLFSDTSECSQQRQIPCLIYILVLLASIGNFIAGYQESVVSGAMLFLVDEFDLNYSLQGAIASATVSAAIPCSVLAAYTNDRFGRKPTQLAASASFICGTLFTALAPGPGLLLVGRLVLGIGEGFVSSTVSIYVAEASPAHVRGALVTVVSVFLVGGQVAATIIAGIFSEDIRYGWRYMLGFAVLPALVMFFGFLFLPESPQWLVSKENEIEARSVLLKLRGTRYVEDELETIRLAHEQYVKRKESTDGAAVVLHTILKTRHVLKALIVGCSLQAIHVSTGVNVFLRYCATIVKMAGIRDNSTAIWLTTLPWAIRLLLTVIGIYLVEKIGRKPLLVVSLIGTCVALSVMAVGFQLAEFTSASIKYRESSEIANSSCSKYGTCYECIQDATCGFYYKKTSVWTAEGLCLSAPLNRTVTTLPTTSEAPVLDWIWIYDLCPTPYPMMVPGGLILFFLFFSLGIGSLHTTVNAEIYPPWATGTGNAIAIAVKSVCILLATYTFLPLTVILSTYGLKNNSLTIRNGICQKSQHQTP